MSIVLAMRMIPGFSFELFAYKNHRWGRNKKDLIDLRYEINIKNVKCLRNSLESNKSNVEFLWHGIAEQ